MSGSSNFEEKIVQLRDEVQKIKASQALGGDNSAIHRYYIEGQSDAFYKKNNAWVTKEIYDDPEWIPIPGSTVSMQSSFYSLVDDPFALIGIEKLEIWRNGQLLTFGNYEKGSDSMFGQMNGLGDRFLVFYSKDNSGWQDTFAPSLGTELVIEASPLGSLNMSSPFQYTYKLWLKSTSPSGYGFKGRRNS